MLPLPEAGEVSVSHAAFDAAVHAQLASVVSAELPVAPTAPTLADIGLRLYVHATEPAA